MKKRVTLALLLSFCTVLSAVAQTPRTDDKDDVVKITTNLVQVDAVVTKDGKPVTNLTADDFEIYEDGRKQAITSFAYISNVASASVATAKHSRQHSPRRNGKRPVTSTSCEVINAAARPSHA